MKYKDMLQNYLVAKMALEKSASELGEAITKIIRDVTGIDIYYTLGWYEAGMETICFWCGDRSAVRALNDDSFEESLYSVLLDVFGDDKFYFDTPSGVHLTKEEAKKLRTALKAFRDGRSKP